MDSVEKGRCGARLPDVQAALADMINTNTANTAPMVLCVFIRLIPVTIWVSKPQLQNKRAQHEPAA